MLLNRKGGFVSPFYIYEVLMKKYIFVIMFLNIFIISCADSNGVVYDYNNESSTLGLTVLLSNTLNFTSQDINTSKDFELVINTNIITLIGIDETSVDYNNNNFVNEPVFEPNTCLQNIGKGDKCKLSIKMNNTPTEGSAGSIKLKFIYNNDDKATTYKYHKLNFTYNNNPA